MDIQQENTMVDMNYLSPTEFADKYGMEALTGEPTIEFDRRTMMGNPNMGMNPMMMNMGGQGYNSYMMSPQPFPTPDQNYENMMNAAQMAYSYANPYMDPNMYAYQQQMMNAPMYPYPIYQQPQQPSIYDAMAAATTPQMYYDTNSNNPYPQSYDNKPPVYSDPNAMDALYEHYFGKHTVEEKEAFERNYLGSGPSYNLCTGSYGGVYENDPRMTQQPQYQPMPYQPQLQYPYQPMPYQPVGYQFNPYNPYNQYAMQQQQMYQQQQMMQFPYGGNERVGYPVEVTDNEEYNESIKLFKYYPEMEKIYNEEKQKHIDRLKAIDDELQRIRYATPPKEWFEGPSYIDTSDAAPQYQQVNVTSNGQIVPKIENPQVAYVNGLVRGGRDPLNQARIITERNRQEREIADNNIRMWRYLTKKFNKSLNLGYESDEEIDRVFSRPDHSRFYKRQREYAEYLHMAAIYEFNELHKFVWQSPEALKGYYNQQFNWELIPRDTGFTEFVCNAPYYRNMWRLRDTLAENKMKAKHSRTKCFNRDAYGRNDTEYGLLPPLSVNRNDKHVMYEGKFVPESSIIKEEEVKEEVEVIDNNNEKDLYANVGEDMRNILEYIELMKGKKSPVDIAKDITRQMLEDCDIPKDTIDRVIDKKGEDVEEKPVPDRTDSDYTKSIEKTNTLLMKKRQEFIEKGLGQMDEYADNN